LPQFDALNPALRRSPPIDAPAEYAERRWTREQALVELVRSRLQGLGPVGAAAIADSLGWPLADVGTALAQLATEGVAMCGAYTDAGASEWCDRALLARIHRQTVQRLRQEIEPVSTQDFVRFLFRWQHVTPGERRQGPDALDAIVAQLQGFEAPAAAWESEILPARLDGYDFTWLDDLCLSGRVVWSRLTPPASTGAAGGGNVIRTTPVALLPRRSAAAWTRAAPVASSDPARMSSRAQAVVDYLQSHGASFYDEILDGTRMLRTQVETALAELVALGRVTSDSFSGLRALLTPSQKRKRIGARRSHRRTALPGVEDAGRWALTRRLALGAPTTPSSGWTSADAGRDAETVEHIAHALLRRYGVVAWRILQREAAWLPPWRELVRVLRRLEARGDVRGGRFVASVTGEQFASAEAVAMLRDTRRAPPTGSFVSVSAADPLNLIGVVLPGAKVAALTSNRVLYRDGAPVATWSGGDVQWIEALDAAQMRVAEHVLTKRQLGAPLLAYLR
jgi:ATP-dependent Lhr-like helicase